MTLAKSPSRHLEQARESRTPPCKEWEPPCKKLFFSYYPKDLWPSSPRTSCESPRITFTTNEARRSSAAFAGPESDNFARNDTAESSLLGIMAAEPQSPHDKIHPTPEVGKMPTYSTKALKLDTLETSPGKTWAQLRKLKDAVRRLEHVGTQGAFGSDDDETSSTATESEERAGIEQFLSPRLTIVERNGEGGGEGGGSSDGRRGGSSDGRGSLCSAGIWDDNSDDSSAFSDSSWSTGNNDKVNSNCQPICLATAKDYRPEPLHGDSL